MRQVWRRCAGVWLAAVLALLCVWSLPVSARAAEQSGDWVGAWSTSPVQFSWKEILGLSCIQREYGLRNLTFRTRLQPTISGEDIRFTLSNLYGTGPLTIDAMTVGRGYEKLPQALRLGTRRTVTFHGSSKVTIQPGETVTTDPVGLSVDALEYITVSLFLKDTAQLKTYGLVGGDTYIMSGNFAGAYTTLGVPMRMEGDFGEYAVIPALTGMEVLHPGASAAVMLGDSTLANDIPLLLARRLRDAGINDVGILQQAIKGNRLLDDGAGLLGMVYGESVMDRFQRDALDQPGVTAIFLKVGDNDIIHPNCASMKDEARAVTAEEMIEGYETLIRQAHERGIRVYLFTRTAWKGYTRNILGMGDDVQWTEELDQMRREINAWIRSADNPADGWIDLDFLCADGEATQLQSQYTTDGIHFTARGQQAVTDAIPLAYFP